MQGGLQAGGVDDVKTWDEECAETLSVVAFKTCHAHIVCDGHDSANGGRFDMGTGQREVLWQSQVHR